MKDHITEPVGSQTLKVAGQVVEVAADALSADQSGVGIEVNTGGGQIVVSLSIGADRRTGDKRRRLVQRFFSFQSIALLALSLITPLGRGVVAVPAVVRFLGLGFFIFVGYFFGVIPLYQGICWVAPRAKMAAWVAAANTGSASLWTLKHGGIVLLWITVIYPLYLGVSAMRKRPAV